ncbi:MAG: mannonate dehydratase [Marivirga sp.]|nr:mannonate dehydratase [Marivirga sp.]
MNGKPFLILGGELHNSSTSTPTYMRPIWEQMKKKNLNTVLAPVYWELLEPEEGHFDFAPVDSMLAGARKQNLRLVLLWFASWKNGYSMYAPSWVKNNSDKYPRAKDEKGKSLQQLSTFGVATAEADARAFKALMKHIRDVDANQQTVIMAQIENEVGLFYTARDHTDAANKAYHSKVSNDLMQYLTAHKGKLQPELDSTWKANGYKTSGTWEQVFGKSIIDQKNWKTLSYLTEELFTVYQYAKYMGTVAAAGKEVYPIPMYVNAWLKQQMTPVPGRYPSGGPTPHTLDVWRAAAPAVDFISPDIYVPDVIYTVEQYHREGNPIFVPEIKPGIASANQAFWILGQHDAIGVAPFGIDASTPDEDPITKTYAALSQVSGLLLQHQGKGTMKGISLDSVNRKQSFELGGYRVDAQLGSGSFAELAGFSVGQKKANIAGGIVINIGHDEFIAIGKDYNLTFTPLKQDGKTLDVDYFDEGTFVNDKWVTTRRLNGDEGTGGGDYGFGFKKENVATLKFQPSRTRDYSIVRFKIYRYW